MPETARGEFVVYRFRGLVRRVARGVSISGQAQRVFAEYSGKIAGTVGETGRLQRRCRDLQQQSERGKHPAEAVTESFSPALRTGDDQPPKATNGTQQRREPVLVR